MRNVDDIAMRDPALAALMGATDADFGADAGSMYVPDPASMEYADTDYSGGSEDDFGVDFGYPFGVEFGAAEAAAPTAMYHPNPQAQQILKMHAAKSAARGGRQRLLEPNLNSDLKVERYTFAVNATITALGTAQALSASNAPDVNFRPQRVVANVVSPGMVMISDGRVANVSFTVGGNIDAWQWNANAVGVHLDVPTLTPANKATFSGSYTGLTPSPLSGTGSYPFSLSFTGPATLAA